MVKTSTSDGIRFDLPIVVAAAALDDSCAPRSPDSRTPCGPGRTVRGVARRATRGADTRPALVAIIPAIVGATRLLLLLVGVVGSPARDALVAAGAITTTVAILAAPPVCAPAFFRISAPGRPHRRGRIRRRDECLGESPARGCPALALALGLGMVTSVAALASSAHAAMHQLVSRPTEPISSS